MTHTRQSNSGNTIRKADAPMEPTDMVVSSGWATFLSVLILVHLMLVAVGLSGNMNPSPLQRNVLSIFAFYTRALNFDLNYTPYYFTHGTIHDVDHRIEVLPDGKAPGDDANWELVSSNGFRGSERYKRYQRLGFTFAYLFLNEDEVSASVIAQSVGTYVLNQSNLTPKQVRVRKHLLQPINFVEFGTPAERDPDSDNYFNVPYAANCIVDNQTVSVVKIDEASQVAAPNSINQKKSK